MSEPAGRGSHDERSASQRIARSTGLRTAGEVVAKLGTLATFVLLARSLGATAYGQFTFALSLASVLVIGTGVGTESLLAREVSRDARRLGELLNDIIVLKTILSVAVVGVAGVLLWLGGLSDTALAVFGLVGAGTLLDNLQRTWHSVFQAAEQAQYIAGPLIVQRLLTAAGTALVLARGGDVVVASGVFLAGSAIGLLLAEVSLRVRLGRPRSTVSPRNWPRLLRAGLPLGLVTVLYVLLLRLDMSLLGFLAGAREVGIYGAAFRLFEATMFVSWAFVGAMAPWLARSAALAPSAVANGMTLAVKTLLAALLPLGVGLAVFAAPIIGLLYGDGYDEAVAPLRVLAVVVVAYGLNELAAALLVNRDRPRRFLVVLGPVIVLNVALNVALLPTYGALAAAWISAACGVVLLLAAAREVRAVTGRLGWTRAALGPGLAGAAMAAVGLLAPGPWPVAALLAGVTYAGVLAGWELRFHAGDADALRSALGRRPVEAATSPV